MFTGIVQTIGRIEQLSAAGLVIAGDIEDLVLGESISVGGVCLTVVSFGGGRFGADVSEETLRRTALGHRKVGDAVNLERAMGAGDRFGGHIVQGHVDGTSRVLDIDRLPNSVEMAFSIDAGLERYLVEKGSVTVDGVSLTVASLEKGRFGVSLIPHTLQSTTFGHRKVGDVVNIEVDVLAKYVERLLAFVSTDQLRR